MRPAPLASETIEAACGRRRCAETRTDWRGSVRTDVLQWGFALTLVAGVARAQDRPVTPHAAARDSTHAAPSVAVPDSAQAAPSVGVPDSAQAASSVAVPDSVRAAAGVGVPDSIRIEATFVGPHVTGDSFKNRVSRLISDQIFNHASSNASSPGVVTAPADEPFRRYHGRTIHDIRIVRVGVFEYYDGNTARSTESTLGGMGETLHIDSRDATIRKYFLMKIGDTVDAEELADTERLLRQTPFVLDAKIEVLPVAGDLGQVDVLVITRDRWSLGIEPTLKTARRYDFDLEERNLIGLGHQLTFNFDVDLDLARTVGYTGIYRSDNLLGTYTRGEYRYRDTILERSHRVQLARERRAPQIAYIGALELESADRLPPTEADNRDSSSRTDVWVGRAFALGIPPMGGTSRVAITPAARVRWVDFHRRPLVTPSVNRAFRDRTLYLGSLSLNRNHFRKGRLIRGYGRSEDVPYGYLFTVTGGAELDEFDRRAYADVKGGVATYSDRFGYLYGAAALSGFRRTGEWEDTALRLEASYFSPLAAVGGFRFRQFADIGYVRGTVRRPAGQLTLDRASGLVSADANDLRGDQRLIATLESVTFAPFQLLGFRFALFEFLSTGTIGPDNGPFPHGRYATTAGFGLRFHNERLIFNPLELRFSFLLTGPDGMTITDYRFGNSPPSDFAGLQPGAPTFVPFE